MTDNDRFSLVSYSSDVTVDIPLTYMTMEEKESAKAAIKALRATGCTALCDGLVNGTCVHHIANLLSVCLETCPVFKTHPLAQHVVTMVHRAIL